MPAQPKKDTVTFNVDCVVLDHNGEVEQSFKAGQVAQLHPASARHWISRGKAVAGKAAADKPADKSAEDAAAE